jgi:cyclase
MTQHHGNRVIEIRHLGRAHTAADLVVHLPKENIAVTGDLVVWPVPLIGSTSYPAEYGATLEKFLRSGPPSSFPVTGR